MAVRQFGSFTATRSTFDETLFDKVRLIDIFNRAGILTHGGSDSGQSDRSATELIDDGNEQLVVDLVETESIYIECFEGV